MILQVCGIIKPTNPIKPLADIIVPINNETVIIVNLRIFLVDTPSVIAVSSPSDNRSNLSPAILKAIRLMTDTSMGIAILYHLAPDSEPHNHIAALSMIKAFGSRVIIKLLAAFNITEIAIPVRMRLLVELLPLIIPMP